jgi:molybdopterin-containing oxidoreductase family iron-sulfur binding subunit
VLKTPSGRYELRPDVLERRPGAPSVVGASAEKESAGPLALLLFEPLPIAGGTGAELPFLQGILDPGLEERWETWAEIHPQTAAALRIRDRDLVVISSPHGSIVARARVGPRVVPGAVAIPVGLGKRAGGRWAAGSGANPLVLLSGDRELFSGLPDPGATRVRIALAPRPEQRGPGPRGS